MILPHTHTHTQRQRSSGENTYDLVEVVSHELRAESFGVVSERALPELLIVDVEFLLDLSGGQRTGRLKLLLRRC